MNTDKIIDATKNFVKQELRHAEGGHDWFHTERVYHTSLEIAKVEKADIFVVSLASLLHDIADSKFHNGDESIAIKKARSFLEEQNVNPKVLDHVLSIISGMSFKNSFDRDKDKAETLEFNIVQDADRLDAIGAIGIARCFNYGGYKNRPLYDPNIPPNLNMTKEEYKAAKGHTLNHFYEKLLLLKNAMQTSTAKSLAEERHQFMEAFLNQFLKEWHKKKEL